MYISPVIKAFTAGFLIVFSFAGCSRDASTPEREKISIALTGTTDTALVQVALEKGFFAAEGLDATPRVHPYGKLALHDMLSGRAEFATAAETPLAFAILDGEDVAVVAMIQSSQKNSAIVARRDRGIRAVRDLQGKTVAVAPGTTMDYYLDNMLSLEGMDRDSVKVVNMAAEEMPTALAQGDVDAASTFDVYALAAKTALGRNAVILQEDHSYTNFFSIVASRDFIGRHPGKVQKMLRALVSAEKFIQQNPEEAQRIVAGFSRIDEAAVRKLWQGKRYIVSLDQTLLLALEDEAAWAIRSGRTKATAVPNFLHHIHLDGLRAVVPSAVNILK